MRTHMKIIIFLITGLSLYAGGVQEKPHFEIEEFHSVSVQLACEVELVKGNDYTMDIFADKKLMDKLNIYNDQGTLVIKKKPGTILMLRNSDELRIVLTLPEWKELKTSASGNISSDESWKGKDFKIRTSASGNIRLRDLRAETVELKCSASGDITIDALDVRDYLKAVSSSSGNITLGGIQVPKTEMSVSASGDVTMDSLSGASEVYFKSSSSGNINLNTLSAKFVQLTATGSGDIQILDQLNCSKLKVNLTSSGNALIRGSSDEADLRTTGSGDIKGAELVLGEAELYGSGSGNITLDSSVKIKSMRFTGSGDYRGK